MKSFFILSFFISNLGLLSLAQASEESMLVRGKTQESNVDRKTGQSLLITPEDASRFDSLTYLKRESSVMTSETGRISPSGFTVPRIRAQDVKLTDVYLEDMLLQDPYSGLPLIEDLDLRAFGALEVHQGLPPADVPGLNPIGTLRYRFRHLAKSDYKLGLQHGSPFGWATWGLAQSIASEEDLGPGRQRELRLYARHHQSSGKYKFYSDEGTPYNKYDDALRIRANNDQRSMQAVPYFHQTIGSYQFEGIGWMYRAERGLPSLSMLQPSDSREEANGHLASFKVSRSFTEVAGMRQILLDFNLTESKDRRAVDDSSRAFLGAASQGTLQAYSRRGRIHGKIITDPAEIFLSYESGMAKARQELDGVDVASLDRKSSVGSVAGRVYPHSFITLEMKGAWRQHLDRQKQTNAFVVLGDELLAPRRVRSSDALGASLSVGDEERGLYLQQAKTKRLPSLIEEYGNGSTIRGNAAIEPETINHQEVGFFVKDSDFWRLAGAVYQDRVDDKIIFVPVMANAVKAQNVRETKVLGFDARAEAGLGASHVYVTFSRLFPYDKTGATQRLLPGIPQRVWAGELEQRFDELTMRWLARYRSEIYRDLANSVRLPGAWIHDANLDYKLEWMNCSWQFGLAVQNVFNLMAVDISAPDTPENRGKTAYSDIAGAPLPGRQWLGSVVINF